MLTLSFFLITLCAVAYVGETLEKDSTPSSLPGREEQELSEIYMLAKESLLDSASASAPYEN